MTSNRDFTASLQQLHEEAIGASPLPTTDGEWELEQFLAAAAADDTHSSDVDPGAVDPWEER